MEGVGALNDWSNELMFEMVYIHLRGAARSWFAARMGDIKTSDQFREKFTKLVKLLPFWETSEPWENI